MNPFLQKMGFAEEDRVLITHVDDIGYSHAANRASFACLDSGSASCGSVLVNGPWFGEAAAICREHPEYDVGVHLTLTAEYDNLRWPALSTRDPNSGLLDEEGYLWRDRADAVRHVGAQAAADEMRAQIDVALEAGIQITHIDTHMGSVVHPKFLGHYLALANEYEVPAFLPNVTRERLSMVNHDDLGEGYLAALEQVDAQRVPTLDEIMIETLIPLDDKTAFYRGLIDSVGPGLTHLLFHPAVDGDELAAITGTHKSRHADYLAFRSTELKDYIAAAGISLIGYRELCEAMN